MVKMKVLEGFVVALDLDSCTSIKKKQEIKKLVTDNDGQFSFVVNRQCNLLVSNIKEKAEDSYKCRLAVKNKIPVVTTDYLHDCVNEGKVLDVKRYKIIADVSTQKFNKGIISTATDDETKQKVSNFLKVWKDGDQDIPYFNEAKYEVLDHECYQDTKGVDSKTFFSLVELHASKTKIEIEDKIHFRIFVHSGFILHGKRDESKEKKEFRFTDNSDVAMSTFLKICEKQNETMKSMSKDVEVICGDLGSKGLQMKLSTKKLLSHPEDGEVEELVNEIWNESIGSLEELLLPASFSLKINQVEKAESILVQLKKLLKQKEGKASFRDLEKEFYETMPHRTEEQLNNMKSIARKLELCQLLKDLVSVGESVGHSNTLDVGAAKKYKSLGCVVKTLTGTDFVDVNNKINESNESGRMKVLRIFKISRPIESFDFADQIGDVRTMFHATKPENVLGILSRGLLLPKIVVDEFGGSLTDGGRLGGGIYFADSVDTSLKYSKSSKTGGKRYMFLTSVALGCCKDFLVEDVSLESSPPGYDSCHAVGKSRNVRSVFEDNEYVIYSTKQQKLEYLMEFHIDSDQNVSTSRSSEAIYSKIDKKEIDKSEKIVKMISEVSLEDVLNLENPLDKLKVGLLLKDSERLIPLKGVHVFVKMIDLVAEVTVLQHYQNDLGAGNSEVKYVFPLDDEATVYGFEAFIGGKHVVGEVKEKEQAREEYKEAVRQGHGAYLMDQDEKVSNLFVISVGNLPAGVEAMIKVTYVTHLSVEDGDVCFNLPGCVAPWKEEETLGTQTQDLTTTQRVKPSSNVTTYIQVSMEMPFEIKRISSPSHNIRFKKTDTKAVVETARNQSLSEGFKLLVMLSSIHVPRMWVERHKDHSNSRACMLTFYPEFDTTELTNHEVVFLVDQSNSMFQSEAMTSARQILLLFLHHLTNESMFNIILFGSDFSKLFSWCKPKSEETMAEAEKFLKSNTETMGRSNVHELLYIFHLLSSPTTTRNIVIITDGYLDDESDVFRSVRNFPSKTRLFGVGVGAVSNNHFLQNLSRVGRGSHEHFDDRFKSKWSGKVKDMLARTNQPSITEVGVEWQNFGQSEDIQQAPSHISSIFNGSRQVVFGFVPNCTVATLKANICGNEISTVISTPDLSITTGTIIHKLTAKAIIQDWLFGMMAEDKLEDEAIKRMKKNYIINLSIKHSIVTKYTSFVAIEERQKDERHERLDVENLLKQNSVDFLSYMDFVPSICKVKFLCSDGSTMTLECLSSSTSSDLLTLLLTNLKTSKRVGLKNPRDGSIVHLENCRLPVWEGLLEYPDGLVCFPVEEIIDSSSDRKEELERKKEKLECPIAYRRHYSRSDEDITKTVEAETVEAKRARMETIQFEAEQIGSLFEVRDERKAHEDDDDDDDDLGFGLFDEGRMVFEAIECSPCYEAEEDYDEDYDDDLYMMSERETDLPKGSISDDTVVYGLADNLTPPRRSSLKKKKSRYLRSGEPLYYETEAYEIPSDSVDGLMDFAKSSSFAAQTFDQPGSLFGSSQAATSFGQATGFFPAGIVNLARHKAYVSASPKEPLPPPPSFDHHVESNVPPPSPRPLATSHFACRSAQKLSVREEPPPLPQQQPPPPPPPSMPCGSAPQSGVAVGGAFRHRKIMLTAEDSSSPILERAEKLADLENIENRIYGNVFGRGAFRHRKILTDEEFAQLLADSEDMENEIEMTPYVREKLMASLQLDDETGQMFWDLTDELNATVGINALLVKQQINGQFSHIYCDVDSMVNLYRTYATIVVFIVVLKSYMEEINETVETLMGSKEFTYMIMEKIPLKLAQKMLATYSYLMEMLCKHPRFADEFQDPKWRDAMSFTEEYLYANPSSD